MVKGRVGVAVGVKTASGGGHSASGADEDDSDGDSNAGLSNHQRMLQLVIQSTAFKTVTTAVIILNVALIVYEADTGAVCERAVPPEHCDKPERLVQTFQRIFLVLYTLEMLLHIYVLRMSFFLSISDLFDAGIVFVGILGEVLGGALPGIAILRLFKVARVSRALRVTGQFNELKVFMAGMNSAAKAILWGSVMIFLFTFVWGLVAVMLIQPVNQRLTDQGVHAANGCDRCERAYESVVQSMLTILQTVVMTDSWGQFTVSIIEESPWTALIFIAISFSTSLCLTNLILAVIIDKALMNQEINLTKQAAEHQKMLDAARAEYSHLCKKIDKDKSGTLTLSEFMSGFDHPEFKPVLTLLDINKEDMGCVFEMMDTDGSGEVSYNEFSYQLQNLKSQDMHTMISFIKFYVAEVYNSLDAVKAKKMSQLPARAEQEAPSLRGPDGVVQVKAEGQVASTSSELDIHASSVPQTLRPFLSCASAASEEESSLALLPWPGPEALRQAHLDLGKQLNNMRCCLEQQVASIRNCLLLDVELNAAKMRAPPLLERGPCQSGLALLAADGLAPDHPQPRGRESTPSFQQSRCPPVEGASRAGDRCGTGLPAEITGGTGICEPHLSVEDPTLLRPVPNANDLGDLGL